MGKCRIIKDGRVLGVAKHFDDSGGYAECVLIMQQEVRRGTHGVAHAKIVVSATLAASITWLGDVEVFHVEDFGDVSDAVNAALVAIGCYAEWSYLEESCTLPDGVTLEFY